MNHYNLLLKFIYAIFIGLFGSILLAMSFTTLMTIATIKKLLPFIIGFNAALTGYNLMTRIKESLKYKRLWSLISGITMVVGVTLILNISFYYYTGRYIVFMKDFLLLTLTGAIFSWLGSILAIKSMDLTITK
jgi:hypothetical protein